MLNGLDLFSGIGGLTIALSEWVKPVIYCEIDEYAQAVLMSRMSEGRLPRAPIYPDVSTLDGTNFRNQIDIIYGGFPCQDISCAGTRVGLAGERSGLFFEIARLVEETNPKFIFLENVPAIRTRGLREVIRTLTNLRYDCRWTRVSAASVGAPHLRERWFLLAYSQRPLADSDESRLEKQCFKKVEQSTSKRDCSEINKSTSRWSAEPKLGRVAYGVPNRVDRIKCLGNAVVPFQAKTAFERLIGLERKG